MRTERIPQEEIPKIIEAVNGRNISYLVYIHDRYELTSYQYCCGTPGRQGEVYDMFEFAIIQGQIKSP